MGAGHRGVGGRRELFPNIFLSIIPLSPGRRLFIKNFESQFCCVRIFFILLQALIEKVVVCLLPLLGGGGRREKPSGVDTQKTYQPFYH